MLSCFERVLGRLKRWEVWGQNCVGSKVCVRVDEMTASFLGVRLALKRRKREEKAVSVEAGDVTPPSK